MKNSIIIGSYVPGSGVEGTELIMLAGSAVFLVIIIAVCISMAVNRKKSTGQNNQRQPLQPQPVQPQMVQPQMVQPAPVQPLQPQPIQSAPIQPVQSQPVVSAGSYASCEEEEGTQIMIEDDDSTQILSQGYSLCLTDINNPDRIFQMPFNGAIVVGRKAGEADLVIDYEKSVSGRHCRLKEVGGRIYIEDLQSANGTLVDGIRIQAETEITTGSVLTLGRLELKVDIRL